MTEICDVRLGMHLLEVEITTKCNLNCAHCYNRTGKKYDMPLERIIDLIGFAEDHGVSKFVVSGGEAVLHPNFDDISDFIGSANLKTKTIIQSNGMIGTVDLDKVKSFDIVHLSFDVDHSDVRRISVNQTLQTARRLIDAGVYTYLFATIYPGNIDKIDWMVDVANESGVDISFNLCIPGDKETLQLMPNQRLSLIKKLHNLYLDKRTLRFSSPYVAVLKGQSTQKYDGIRGGCTAGIAACVILPNGDVAPCPFFRLKAGNIYDQSLQEIWLESRVFNTLRDRSAYVEPCGSCEYLSYCGGCRARAYEQNGKLNDCDVDCIL